MILQFLFYSSRLLTLIWHKSWNYEDYGGRAHCALPEHCVTGTEVLNWTGTRTKDETINMTGPGPGPGLEPEI